MVLFVVGFMAIARFVPPPDPADSPQAVAQRFTDDQLSIRIGLVISLFAAALLLPWYATLTVQVKRIEGRFAPMSYVQLAAGACLIVEFLFPLMFWAADAYRPDLAPETIQRFNDLAWFCMLGLVTCNVIQCFSLGWVVISDNRATPVFPRWFAYLNFWAGLLYTPAIMIIFFKHGPFAWNGIIAFWTVITAFFVWLATTTVLLGRAIRAQAGEPAPLPLDAATLIARIDELEDRLSRPRPPL
jgi:hypothetical protein